MNCTHHLSWSFCDLIAVLRLIKRWQSDHTCRHPHRFNERATKSEKWNGKPRPECVDGRHPHSKTPMGVLSEMTEHIDWRARQPSQMACFSEELKSWGAWETTWRHKVKEVTLTITWRRDARKEEALVYSPSRDESIRWIITIIIDNFCIALFSDLTKLTAF